MVKNFVLKASWAAGYLSGRTQATRDDLVSTARGAYHDGWLAGRQATPPPHNPDCEQCVKGLAHTYCDDFALQDSRYPCRCIESEPESVVSCPKHGEG